MKGAASHGPTLWVGRSGSRCSACGRPASHHQKSHDSQPGYGPPRPGCGVVWTHVGATDIGTEAEAAEAQATTRAMRPDLIFVGREMP